MEGGDFLKKLKKSLDEGKEDSTIREIHYEILNKADKVKAIHEEERNAVVKEEKVAKLSRMDYIQQVDEFLVEPTLQEKQVRAEVLAHEDDVMNFVGVEISPTEIDRQNKKIEDDLKNKNTIETNNLNINLLEGEITSLQAKIQKNIELIAFLKSENIRYAK